jgi:hypothetical protein
MPLTLKRAKDAGPDELWMKLLFYGDSGAGKTWLAASADNCAVLLTERNGEHSIRMSNPDAMYVFVTTADEVKDFLRMALHGQFREMGINTLVFDGLTEIQRLFKDSIEQERGDGEFSIRDWGTLHEKMRGFLRMLRDLDYHVVCTALSATETADEIHYTKPSFQGRNFPDEVMQYFNAVGYVFKRGSASRGGLRAKQATDGGAVEHAVMFDGPARIKCKNCHPLRGVQTGTAQHFIDVLAGKVQLDAPTPEPEEPTAKAMADAATELAETGQTTIAKEAPKEAPKTAPKRRGRRKMGSTAEA